MPRQLLLSSIRDLGTHLGDVFDLSVEDATYVADQLTLRKGRPAFGDDWQEFVDALSLEEVHGMVHELSLKNMFRVLDIGTYTLDPDGSGHVWVRGIPGVQVTIYEDTQDPNNKGWAYRVRDHADGHEESGAIDNLDDLERILTFLAMNGE